MAENQKAAPAQAEARVAARRGNEPASDAKATEQAAAETQKVVQERLQEGLDKGYLGHQVDATPREAYSLEDGGNPGHGTPEADPENFKR